MATIPLTRRGADLLKSELQRLKSVERHAVIQAIAEARAQGDLSENAEYEAAKDKQGFIEVGDDEADLKLGLISISSPISRALIGKQAGDVAEVQAPGGLRHWEIVDVRYG